LSQRHGERGKPTHHPHLAPAVR